MNSFYTEQELKGFGFKSLGANVLLSRKTSIYGADQICIGNNVRIDDFCILSGKIQLGSYIHISAYSSLFAGDVGIVFEDYVTYSSRCAIYAVTDDYSGIAMTNPMLPSQYTHVTGSKVVVHEHAIIGSGCTILPGAEIGEGTAIGSMSLVTKSLAPWGIYYGIPAKRIKERSTQLLEMEKRFTKEVHDYEG